MMTLKEIWNLAIGHHVAGTTILPSQRGTAADKIQAVAASGGAAAVAQRAEEMLRFMGETMNGGTHGHA